MYDVIVIGCGAAGMMADSVCDLCRHNRIYTQFLFDVECGGSGTVSE